MAIKCASEGRHHQLKRKEGAKHAHVTVAPTNAIHRSRGLSGQSSVEVQGKRQHQRVRRKERPHNETRVHQRREPGGMSIEMETVPQACSGIDTGYMGDEC